MENFIEILKYIGPLVGVYIGWLLTKKSETDKIKYSEIRQIKRSLFILLEIRNQLVVSKRIETSINIFTEKLNIKLEKVSSEKLESNELNEFIKKILPSLIGDNFQKDLNDQFKKCIDNLSEIDPVLAFRINGKQNIQDYMQSWENETNKQLKLENIEDVQLAIQYFRPKMVDEINSDLEEIIIEVANLINGKEVETVKNIINEPTKDDLEYEVDNYIDIMFEGLL